jgi:hypothetical protein
VAPAPGRGGRPRGPPGPTTAPGPSTASWLRGRLRLGAGAATSCVRIARARFGGPLTRTAQALCAGELSVAHAAVLAHGTQELPDQVAAEAEPVLVAAARRLDPLRLRRLLGHLQAGHRPPGGRAGGRAAPPAAWGLWLALSWEGWSPCKDSWRPRLARPCWPPWTLARPSDAQDTPAGTSAALLPWSSWPPHPGGRPAPPERREPPPTGRGGGSGQPARWPRAVGGELGWVGSLAPGGVSAAGL